MLEVDQALQSILSHTQPLKPTISALMSSSMGQVIAEDLRADLDSPPFAKALMDGYAIRLADLVNGQGTFEIIEQVAAGAMPMKALQAGQATRIFTGAALPEGANAVIKQELATNVTDSQVTLSDPAAMLGRNVMPRGQEMRAGEVVLPKGTVISPAVFGICATLGKTAVSAIPPAMVGIIVTGDELVEANMKPMGGQIRNSNGPMLTALTVRAGALPRYLGIAPDNEAILTSVIKEGLSTTNVLLLAGGVSVGQFDLVPKVLESLGVTIHFHQVRMKPGKPLLFGSKGNCLVFGLPGNPVSSFVSFELFVRPTLRTLAGKPAAWHPTIRATLSEAFTANNDRPTYHPVKLHGSRDGATVTPLPWFNSADLRALLAANSLMALPAGEVNYAAGDVVDVVVI